MLVVFSDMIDPRITRDVENVRFLAVVKNADVKAYILCEVFGLARRDGVQQEHLKVLRPTLIGGGRG